MKLSVAVLATSAVAYSSTDGLSPWEKFEKFATHFKRQYKSETEKLQKFAIFVENLEMLQHLELQETKKGGAVYGYMSPFADWSLEQFSTRNSLEVTKQKIKDHALKAEADLVKTEKALKEKQITMAPASFDWREKGAVNEVKNQGQCGSCWAFGTNANIEGNNFVMNKVLVSLSEQELVDCDGNDNGCNGGLPENAYEMMLKDHVGLEKEDDYTYDAEVGKCAMEKSKEVVFLADWLAIPSNEDKIAQALVAHGPLVLGINAGPMQLYMGGVADPFFCNPLGIDHAVTFVGYGEEGSKPFWIIRNSWGPEWGEKGYYRIIRGKGKCGLNRMVTTGIVSTQSQSNALPAPGTIWV